jgi:hypothetical protein
MNHENHIPGVEFELAKAKKAATPVIVECTERSRDRVVFEDRTHGTTRVDHLVGGVNEQYHERPVIKEAVTLEKSVDPTVGKIVSEDEQRRVIKLAGSGTVRTDHRQEARAYSLGSPVIHASRHS